jgi:DNA-binding CsgD family transcriptional regulator
MSIRPNLLGRSDEVAEVLLILRRTARRGRGAVVVVTGEAGIGKSALVRTITPEAVRMGFTVGVGKAEEIGQIAPAAPLLLALRSGARPVLSPKAFADLGQVADQPLWLVDRIAASLEDLLTRGPLLLVVDDYHWADRLTRLAVRLLIDRLVGLPVVWLLAARGSADAVEAELDVPDGSTTVHRLTLGRLADAVIQTLATEALGAAPAPTVRDHLRGAGGNPLVALQYLAGASGASSSPALPDSLIAAVRARLRLLGPDTRRLIELIAVWGRPATRSEVIEMTPDLPSTAVLAAVSEARAADLLDEQAEVLALRHDLVRDAVYLDIPPTVRAATHRRCGEYLLATRDALAAAPHMAAAATLGDVAAIEVLRRAAEQSVAPLPDTAAELIKQAFALVPLTEPSWLDVGEQCAAILARVQRSRESLEVVDSLLARITDAETRARLQVTAAQALWLTGSLTEVLRRVDGALDRPVSAVTRTRLLASRALATTRVGSAETAGASARLVLDEARTLGDASAEQVALQALGEVARNELRHDDALAHFRDLRAGAGTNYLGYEVASLRLLDRFDEAADTIAAASDDVDAAQVAHLPAVLEARMWQDFMLGRLDDARSEALTLDRVSRTLEVSISGLEATMVLTLTAILSSDLTQARRVLRAAEPDDRTDPIVRTPRVTLLRSLITGLVGRPAEAVALVRPVMAVAERSHAYFPRLPEWMRVHTGLALAAGDTDFARQSAERARRAADRNPGVASLEGIAQQTRGLVEGDAALLRDAVAVLEDSPRPLLLGGALLDLGGALLDRGERDAARPHLQRASAIFDDHGAVLLSARSDALLTASGDPRATPRTRSRRPEHGWDALTPAERRVTALISGGLSNQRAARQLDISANTVATHLRSVFAKLEVTSRVQLANRWHEHQSSRQSG